MKFTIRDLVWATLCVAILVWFAIQRGNMRGEVERARLDAEQSRAKLQLMSHVVEEQERLAERNRSGPAADHYHD